VATHFTKLNDGWDANPGAPEPNVQSGGAGLTLTFLLDPVRHPQFRDCDRGQIFFPNCWRYRLGYPNDEGWSRGHCRFRCWAPEWGDFYEVAGDLYESGATDWILIRHERSEQSRHFLFYFKDETFECDADGWAFKVLPVSNSNYERYQAPVKRIEIPRTALPAILLDLVSGPIRLARRWIRAR
jgi:hypothetical protein